jgi:hypothetical protein
MMACCCLLLALAQPAAAAAAVLPLLSVPQIISEQAVQSNEQLPLCKGIVQGRSFLCNMTCRSCFLQAVRWHVQSPFLQYCLQEVVSKLLKMSTDIQACDCSRLCFCSAGAGGWQGHRQEEHHPQEQVRALNSSRSSSNCDCSRHMGDTAPFAHSSNNSRCSSFCDM